jgi:hypothetical protein
LAKDEKVVKIIVICMMKMKMQDIKLRANSLAVSYLGLPVEHEYMRRLPLLYRKDTLARLRSHYPELNSRLEILGSRAFSEFNFIGGFIQHFEPHLYSIVNTEDELPEPLCKQFWSWGGLSPTINAEIESMLQ